MGKITTIYKQKPLPIKNKALTYVDYDVDDLNYRIYNDLPLDSDYEQDIAYEKRVNKLLMEGETARLIVEIPTDTHFITSYGRVINAKRLQQMTISNVRDELLAFYCLKKRWVLEEIMESYGFNYDKDKQLEFYKSIDYPIRKQRKN